MLFFATLSARIWRWMRLGNGLLRSFRFQYQREKMISVLGNVTSWQLDQGVPYWVSWWHHALLHPWHCSLLHGQLRWGAGEGPCPARPKKRMWSMHELIQKSQCWSRPRRQEEPDHQGDKTEGWTAISCLDSQSAAEIPGTGVISGAMGRNSATENW